jgi:hypothetical protein
MWIVHLLLYVEQRPIPHRRRQLTVIPFKTWDNYEQNLEKRICYLSYRVAGILKFVEYIEKQRTEGSLRFNEANHSP